MFPGAHCNGTLLWAETRFKEGFCRRGSPLLECLGDLQLQVEADESDAERVVDLSVPGCGVSVSEVSKFSTDLPSKMLPSNRYDSMRSERSIFPLMVEYCVVEG